jgi:hydroxymethylpyrimidine pyrophosphatase-like HAD family hydrolase
LNALLTEMQIPASEVVAAGDAENDIAFLQAAGFPVAVANALPSVKAVARLVTQGARGTGVAELIDRLLEKSNEKGGSRS